MTQFLKTDVAPSGISMKRRPFRRVAIDSLCSALVAAASAGVSMTALAQAASDPAAGKPPTMKGNADASAGKSADKRQADRTFVRKAAAGGMAEIALGKLAKTQGGDEQVRQFGDRMMGDHTKANDQLKSIATLRGIAWPEDLPQDKLNTVHEMATLSGKAFDRAYVKAMVSDHVETVALFEKEAKSGRDAELQRFASSTLPTLRQHLEMARELQDGVKSE